MDKTYHFMAGLSRSGSTVLASILNQNPNVYVTPTSPMLQVTSKLQEIWDKEPAVNANRFVEQINNITKAILPAFWKHRSEPIIIDKDRAWGKNMLYASELFGREMKAIVTERDLPSVMASWLSLIKKDITSNVDKILHENNCLINDDTRMGFIWYEIVKEDMEVLKQIKIEAPNKIVIVNYDDLINQPIKQIQKIEEFLELPKWNYNFDDIENDTQDADLLAWGIEGLHTIRPKLQKTAKDPKEILGEELYNRFVEMEKDYKI
jgi:sulfotransferase